MNNQQYKNHTFKEMQEMGKEFPDYSVGEVFYAVSRLMGISKISDFLNKTDEEFFSAVNKAREEEKEII